MRTKFYLAGLAGAVVSYLLSWLVFGFLLMSFFSAHTIYYDGLMYEMPKVWVLIIAFLLEGFMLAFIFERWAKIATFKSGLVAGLILGLFISGFFDAMTYSMMHLYRARLLVVDVLCSSVITAIAGGVVGLVLSNKEKK